MRVADETHIMAKKTRLRIASSCERLSGQWRRRYFSTKYPPMRNVSGAKKRPAGAQTVVKICPGRALAAGDVTLVRPRGKAKTFDMKAHGARIAKGATVTTTMAQTQAATLFQAERFFASRATSNAPKAMGHAVSFIAAARPRLIPAKLFCLRCNATTPSNVSARIGMSSPPVERKSAPVGRARRNCATRIFFDVDDRKSPSANRLAISVRSDMAIRGSVRPLVLCVSADGRPKIPINGKYGKNDS